MRRICYAAGIALIVGWFGVEARGASGHSPADVLASFRLADSRLVIEAAATEPEVLDPVDIAWDEAGRMYVVEMRDYPVGSEGGTIRRLEDTDGDGRYERATIFARVLPFPSSCLPWRGGLLVTAAPDILYLKDADGDGHAEERRVILTGFALGDQQLRVNGLTFGLDGWIYAANGRLGGMIRRPDQPEAEAVSIPRADLRFNPDTGEFEALSGPSQFGLARDDFGNRFLSWNTVPIRHVVIEDRFIAGTVSQSSSGIASVIPAEDIGRLYPIAPPERRHNRESVEFFNASCGTTVYRGDAIPFLRGDVFVCESLGSLVHHRNLAMAGATFVSSRVEEGREFLASTDSWFRPVNLESGPDGALYVVDMCRKEIEHPDFIPREFQAGMDFRAGENLGRIWRIRLKETMPPNSARWPGDLDAKALAGELNTTQGWTRDTAQRLLLERADPACAGPLQDLAVRAKSAETRLSALWTLSGLARLAGEAAQWLPDNLLRQVLNDADGRVRRGALQVLQSVGINDGGWDEDLFRLAADPEIAVRMEVALASGALRKESRFKIMRRIAQGGTDDAWLRTAVVIAAKDEAWELAGAITESEAAGGLVTEASRELLFLLARAAALSDAVKPAAAFADYCVCDGVSRETQIALLAGYLEGLDLKGFDAPEVLSRAGGRVRNDEAAGSTGIGWFMETSRAMAVSDGAAITDRVRAVRVMSLAPADDVNPILLKLLAGPAPDEVRAEAARVISRQADPATVEKLLGGWNLLPSGTRRGLMVDLARRPASAQMLIAAAEEGRLSRIELRGAAGEALSNHPDETLRARAAQLFSQGGDRAGIVAGYRASLELKGDSAPGAAQFVRNCIVCHRVQGLGHSVGPDLSGIASRARQMLLSDILDPSIEVAPDYVNYIAETRDGEVVSGLLVREGAAGVTLRQAQGMETTITADRLAEFRAGAVSLMPEGFEEAMDTQAMSDLLEFLHHGTREELLRAMDAHLDPPAP